MKNFLVVLVTGAAGFVGSHCVKLLLWKGYKVRGTLRDFDEKEKADALQKICARIGRSAEQLELVEAELLNQDCWKRSIA